MNSIRANKLSIQKSINRVNAILKNDPQARAKFKAILAKHKKAGHFMGATDDTPWYKSGFATDLFDLTKDIVKSKTIGSEQRKILDAELAQIEAKNRSLDKQLTLTREMSAAQKAKAFGGSFIAELMDSPIKIAAIAGLGFLLFKRLK